jgi:hypothetical protein
VLILGALALISVLTVVYVTIGQSDRRSAAVTVRRDNVEAVAAHFADYAARVIAEGVFATYVDGREIDASGNLRPVLVRRLADYPFTDPYRLSVTTNAIERFDPTGSYDQPWTASPIDPRIPATPFLASTTPTWLPPPGFSGNNPPNFMQHNSWLHITNIAPDGQFVNKYNLAYMSGGVRVSNFNARRSVNPASPAVGDINYGLGLLDDNGMPSSTLAFGGTPNPNRPADWTLFQRGAYRSTRPVDWPAALRDPSSPLYPPSQWGDADGDGFFDSRWFELVRASDPNNILSLLPQDGRYRWFAAVRIVDLSALVNINTATDFRTPARAAFLPGGGTPTVRGVVPTGRHPGDIDLRRLFTMPDSYLGTGTGPRGYEHFFYDPSPWADLPPSVYNDLRAAEYGDMAYRRLSSWLRPVLPFGAFMRAEDRLFYYEELGSRTAPNFAGGRFEFAPLFGIADLFELLTYRTVNSPHSSRLEEAAGGHGPQGRLSPLRDSRTVYDERDGATLQQIFARSMYDVRQFLTTISGARPLRSGMLPAAGYASGLRPEIDLAVDAYRALAQATSVGAEDPGPLFGAYVSALLPHAWRPGAWTAARATLHYGGDPELALRAAAHMAVNMAAAYSRRPRGYTLLIDNSLAAPTPDPGLQDQARFPFWVNRDSNEPRRFVLDAGPQVLAPASAGLSARAINIYPVEPQPFLTRVVAIHLYTDAPMSAGGDSDWDADPNIPPSQQPEITIHGGMTLPTNAPNPDLAGQFIAFELTNPFDVEIELTTSTGSGGYSEYYIEFRGHLYKLADIDRATGAESNIKLMPGETRFAVAMSHSPETLRDKWSDLLGAAITVDTVWEVLEHQFSIEPTPGAAPIAPWFIWRMNEATGDLVPLSDTADLFSSAVNPNDHDIYLWRTLEDAPLQLGDPGYRQQHMLADRLRDPGPAAGDPPTLDRRLPASNQDINGTTSGPEGTEDNTGFSIALWGSLRRRDDPGGGSTPSIPRGAIPAYCLEAKWDGPLSNHTEDDGADPASLKRGDFVFIDGTSPPNAAVEFNDLLNKLRDTGTAPPPLIPQARQHPSKRETDTIPDNLNNRPYEELYIELLVNGEKFEADWGGTNPPTKLPTLRIGDMLLPLAIGPSYDPAVNITGVPHAGRITLSEALALALHYSTPPLNLSPPTGSGMRSPFDIWHKIGDVSDPDFHALDRGQLMLDRFVPHEVIGSAVHRRFPGIPLALNILNIFRMSSDPQLGSLTRKTPGLININTAPATTLRTVPYLSPTVEYDSSIPLWNQHKNQAGITGGITFPEMTSDIAAALIAYRDKVPIFDRGGLTPTGTPVPPYLNRFDNSTGHPVWDPNLNNNDGRWRTTAIHALREAPGFATPGEIMATIERDMTGPIPAPTGNARLRIENQIDFLGLEGERPSGTAQRSGTAGLVTTLYDDGAGNLVPNAIPDSYDEQLLIANAALGSISVRSDVFAVWILLHGYQRSDTENLRREDPLTPSIAKRYLMVVDRSNITRKGEQPNILLFREVPIR